MGRIGRLLGTVLVCAVLGAAGRAEAAPNVFTNLQLGVRGTVEEFRDGRATPIAGGATVSYWGRSNLSWDVSLGRGLGRDASGLWGSALLRYASVFGERGEHAVGVGAGASRFLGCDDFGPVTLARVEVFYEMRLREGLNLFAAGGPERVMAASRRSADAGTPVHPGEVGISLTAGAGWSF